MNRQEKHRKNEAPTDVSEKNRIQQDNLGNLVDKAAKGNQSDLEKGVGKFFTKKSDGEYLSPYLFDYYSTNLSLPDPDVAEGFDNERIGHELFLRFLDEAIERADRRELDQSSDGNESDQS